MNHTIQTTNTLALAFYQRDYPPPPNPALHTHLDAPRPHGAQRVG